MVLNHYKSVDLLTFRLQSPSLTVTDVDWGVPAEHLAKFYELLSTNGNALRVGERYDQDRVRDSWFVLDRLIGAVGTRSAISQTAYLDYREKTAKVTFKIWEGPPGEPQRLLPPDSEPCRIMIGNFNLTDVDDLSPAEFVEQQMRTKWLGCFSETDAQYDSDHLKGMKFLKESSIAVDGSGESRSISVHLRGVPIPIASVNVQGYGLLDGIRQADLPPLTIHPGDIYSRAANHALRQLLADSLWREGARVIVYSDVQVNEAGGADLNFSALAYPDDVVYIDGERFDNSPAKR